MTCPDTPVAPASPPVTVIVCAVSQLLDVNVRLDALTVPSVVSELVTAIDTSAAGSVSSTTVNVAVPPASVVLPLIAPTVTPAVPLLLLSLLLPHAVMVKAIARRMKRR